MEISRIKTRIALRLIRLGIWLLELQPYGLLDAEDKENLSKLWKLHDEFSARL